MKIPWEFYMSITDRNTSTDTEIAMPLLPSDKRSTSFNLHKNLRRILPVRKLSTQWLHNVSKAHIQ